jgi:hypothetical protein
MFMSATTPLLCHALTRAPHVFSGTVVAATRGQTYSQNIVAANSRV